MPTLTNTIVMIRVEDLSLIRVKINDYLLQFAK